MRQAIIAPQQDRLGDERTSKVILAGLLLSLLLHALVVVLLLEEPWMTWRKPAEPAPLEITMVIPEPPKAEPPRPAPVQPPPPPPPQPQPQPQPEVQTPPAPPPPPEVPQLQRGRVAEQSAVPKPEPRQQPRPQAQAQPQAQPQPQPKAEPLPRSLSPATSAPARQPMTREQAAAAARTAPEMVQSERDFFLSQIVDHMFIDLDAPQFERIQIYGAYVVMPDGMMAPPFDKSLPFDMSRMVDAETWQMMQQPSRANLRVAMESFLRGMYLAQPLQLPPNFGNQPKRMTLNFKMGDLR